MSRLPRLQPATVEALLHPTSEYFEYWGHEASWMPLELYSTFEFRRQAFRKHPWWGNLVGKHPRVARELLARIRSEGPLRSQDINDSKSGAGWWNFSLTKKVATALWSSGELAIRERRGFLRTFDLAERVIPQELRTQKVPRAEALRQLLLRALAGFGWATATTLAQTWRLRRLGGRGQGSTLGARRARSDRAMPGDAQRWAQSWQGAAW